MKPIYSFMVVCSLLLSHIICVRTNLRSHKNSNIAKKENDYDNWITPTYFIETESKSNQILSDTIMIKDDDDFTAEEKTIIEDSHIKNEMVAPEIVTASKLHKKVNFMHTNEKVVSKKNDIDQIVNNQSKYLPVSPLEKTPGYANHEKAYNFNPVFARKIEKHMMEIPIYVKELTKEGPKKDPRIPKSFVPVTYVKELSDAGKADLKIQEFYHE